MQKLYEAVLGEKNSAYYLSKFQKFDQQPSGLQASWNLCAFFFNGLWALHRKMYSWFFVFWGVVAIKNITAPESPALLFVVPCIVFGIFADSLYHHSVKKKIAAAQLTIKDEAQLVEFLRKKGGVNTWVVWFFFGVPTIAAVVLAAINALQTYKIINKAPTGVELIFYLLIVLAIIFAVYTYWFKKETPQKYTNADGKETKPQNPSEKTESIPSSYLYEIIAGEMERKEYKKGLATRAFAEANGDRELAKSLYIKFRYAELFSEMEVERKEKQRQQQMEDDRIERERTETQQGQSIWTKDWTGFGIFTNDWVIVTGICFVAFFIWFGSKPESTTTTNTPPATVTTQSIPQATAQDIFQRADNLYKQGQYAEALPLFQGLAEQGMPLALGVMYKYGEGVEQDFNQAVIWFGKAAEQGDARAQYELGIIYDNGNGVVKDYTQATYWYRKAAEQGNADAITALKKLEVNAPNSQQTNTQVTPQAVTENPNCIGDCINGQGKYIYANGETYSGNFKNGIREGYGAYIFVDGSKYVGEWKNGEPVEPKTNVSTTAQSQPELTHTKTNSTVTFTDGKTGITTVTSSDGNKDGTKQIIQATPQDISQRADNLYNQGRYVEVLPLYQSLAEQGDAQAQTNLGFMYITGQGVALDNNQAVYWFSKAAGQGYGSAQYNLGLSYHNGKGVTKDETKAVAWYRKAAEQGIALAQLNLGLSYHDGKGVTKDESQAVYWFRKAAEQGNANAIANLKKLGQ